jgi:hypothetical protein
MAQYQYGIEDKFAMSTHADIIARIQKLLALSQHNPSEAEAALAAAKVQELLQAHNLTLTQIEASGTTSNDPAGKRAKEATGHKAMYGYQQRLMSSLADLNFCLHMVQTVQDNGRRSRRHTLVGRVVNIQATQMTYDYLITTMRRLVIEAGHAYGKEGEQDLHRWIDGCTETLCSRLETLRREREEADAARQAAQPQTGNGSGRELVLSDVYGSETDLNNDHLNGFPPGTTATKRREREDKQAAQTARHDELVAQGMDSTKAWYVAFGYGEEQAAQFATQYTRTSRRRSRGGRGRTTGWTQRDEANYRKTNSASYKAGREAGKSIGLDPQVSGNSTKRIGG